MLRFYSFVLRKLTYIFQNKIKTEQLPFDRQIQPSMDTNRQKVYVVYLALIFRIFLVAISHFWPWKAVA